MSDGDWEWRPAPGWPAPPAGWIPAPDWKPDPSWPKAPEGYSFWQQTALAKGRRRWNIILGAGAVLAGLVTLAGCAALAAWGPVFDPTDAANSNPTTLYNPGPDAVAVRWCDSNCTWDGQAVATIKAGQQHTERYSGVTTFQVRNLRTGGLAYVCINNIYSGGTFPLTPSWPNPDAACDHPTPKTGA
jgi:hypothetical protein